MSETLVAVAFVVISAGLAWVIARWSGPAGTTRHRAVLFVSFVTLFTLGSATRPDRILLDLLMPHARAWKHERDADALLHGTSRSSWPSSRTSPRSASRCAPAS